MSNNVTLRIVFRALHAMQCSISHSISVCLSNAGIVIKQIKLRSHASGGVTNTS